MITSRRSSDSHPDGVTSGQRAPEPRFLERRTVLYAAVGIAVALGLVFRIVQYAADRSLWFDESMLAFNILHRSAAGLTGTLDFAQAAPLGFLELEKLATHLFGDSELALRLLPFLCGLASVPLFAALALRLLRPAPALLATLVFACALGPVYYASELKQYSGDLLVAIGLTLLATVLLDGALSRRRLIVASLAGSAAILLSHASVFVAGGIALALAVRALIRRDRQALEAFAVTVPWLLTSLFVVVFTTTRTGQLDAVIGADSSVYGSGAGLGSKLDWPRDVAGSLLRSTGYPDSAPDHYLHWPLLALVVVGAVGLARRRPTVAAFLLLPFVLTWIASADHQYPIFDRTVLFLVPATVLFVAGGAAVLVRAIRPPVLRACAAVILAAAVLLVPLVHAAARTVDPVQHEELKQALAFVDRRWQPGDGLFVDGGARFALRYYLDCNCLSPTESGRLHLARRFGERPGGRGHQPVPLRNIDPKFVVGRLGVRGPGALAKQLRGLNGRPRVWILYTHLSSAAEAQRIAATLRRLDRVGRRLASFDGVGAHAYLYDLRTRSP